MSIDNPTILLVGLFALCLGAVGCLYIIFFSLRKMRGKGATTSEERPGAEAARASWSKRFMSWMSEPISASAKSSSRSPSTGGSNEMGPASPNPIMPSSEDGVEVMRVLRRGAIGELVIEVEGREYRRLEEIQDGALGRRVLLAIQELTEFAGDHGRRPMPEMQRLASPPREPAEYDTGFSAEQDAFLAQLQESEPDDTVQEEKTGLMSYWRRGFSRSERQAAAKGAEGPPKSFIDEIEEMLQLRMAGRPEMDSHSVHFKSTATGELWIEVDGGRYEAIDDVPYPEVRSMLKATITAWELG